jgi:release factor glutamine methyltransferase
MSTNNNTSTVGDFLLWATTSLTKAGISSARLDSLILLEDTLDLNRAQLLAHPEYAISTEQRQKLYKLIERRRRHIPLAYLRGSVFFYGRVFHVTHNTLVPRPETEEMITLLKTLFQDSDTLSIADIGTGSGSIGLTAAIELPGSNVDCYDIDAKALAVAKENALSLGISAHFYKEDLLEHASERRYDVVLANLPYVADNYEINEDAKFEPRIALFAGPDGLRDYRTFWSQLKAFKHRPKYVLTESEPTTQHEPLVELARETGYKLSETHGFIQLFSA